jgi:DNA-binding CsgD family transcriptional regulator
MGGGPVQLMAFSYSSGTGAEDRVLAELDALQGRRVLRLLDFLFVNKTPEGDLVMLDVGDDEDYGTILAGFFETGGGAGAPLPGEVDADELLALAESLEPGEAMALVLVEHVWAGGLFSAVEEFGGELAFEGFITGDGQVIVGDTAEMAQDARPAATERAETPSAWGEQELEDAEVAEAEAELHNFEAFDELQTTERFAARIEAGMEAGMEAGATLTKADRALLADLSTDLTFAMIADRLGISRGAVKERASRVYGKLGVHSRAEAVEAALRLGLLGG